MNAIVGLCHFCEAHGPRPVFCTFTTDNEAHKTEAATTMTQCTGCKSVGPETVLVTRDDHGTLYCSRESVPNPDVTAFLRQAAIRSITCEISWSKDGGVVYFSDIRGHVLSLTFQLRDSRARGLKRWFAIVVLMKDKMLLLNNMPLLSEHMQKISKELQDFAETVYDDEQKVCSQRALRLNTGSNYFGQSRSLTQLTGQGEIFKSLHLHFTWMLKTGSLTYTETLYTSQDLLKKLNLKESKGHPIFSDNACTVQSSEECIPLRALENLVSKSVFRKLLYCALNGVHIMIKSTQTPPDDIASSLRRLLPGNSEMVPRISIIHEGVVCDDRATLSSTGCCILKECEDSFICQWSGSLPNKCPTLMNRVESAMANSKFDDEVLHQHVKSLQLEWLGIATTLKSTMDSSGEKSSAVAKLKQVLGVTPQDDLLVNYWISAFCS